MTAPAPLEHTARPRSAKGRPQLGPREIITAALWPRLEALVDTARGSLDRSPYLADLLAWHVGRPDLIRHTQLVMDFEQGQRATSDDTPAAKTRHCTVRVHPAVADELDRRATEFGCPRAVYIADAIAERLGARRSRTTTKAGVLPLAV